MAGPFFDEVQIWTEANNYILAKHVFVSIKVNLFDPRTEIPLTTDLPAVV